MHVEDATDLSIEWRKSSFSNGSQQCVELGKPSSTVTAVRDSKNPSGPALMFSNEAVAALVASCAAGEFDFGLVDA